MAMPPDTIQFPSGAKRSGDADHERADTGVTREFDSIDLLDWLHRYGV